MSIPIIALSLAAVIAVAVQTVTDYSDMVAAQRVASELARRDAALLEECQNPLPEECVPSDVCLDDVNGTPIIRITAARTWNPALWARWGTVTGTYLYELGAAWTPFPWLPGTEPCATS